MKATLCIHARIRRVCTLRKVCVLEPWLSRSPGCGHVSQDQDITATKWYVYDTTCILYMGALFKMLGMLMCALIHTFQLHYMYTCICMYILHTLECKL